MADSPQEAPYVPYEDLQRDLGRVGNPAIPRPRSSPNLPSEVCKAVTASAIAQVGGFRREHLHQKREPGEDGMDVVEEAELSQQHRTALLLPQGFRHDESMLTGLSLEEAESPQSQRSRQLAAAITAPLSAETHTIANLNGSSGPTMTGFGGFTDSNHLSTSSGLRSSGGTRRPPAAFGRSTKGDQLLWSINSNVAYMVSFYSSLDASQTEDLFGRPLDELEMRSIASTMQEPTRGMTTGTTVIAILKAFVCTSVLYLPNAFAFGGWAASLAMLALSGAFCVLGLSLLAECHAAHSLPYPEMGGLAFGPRGRDLIAVMLVLSQFSFCVSGHVLVARSLREVFRSYNMYAPTAAFYFGQVLVFIPLGWIRRIEKMKVTNVLGDIIVVGGLAIVVLAAFCKIGASGVAESSVAYAPRWTSFIGTSVYSFEGIGVAIPIREAMRHSETFDVVMGGSVAMVAVIIASVGLAGYLAWGASVNPVVLNELPAGVGRTTLVVVYAVAVACVYPLTIFPTYNIMEQRIFKQRFSQRRKWLKNLFRTSVTFGGVTLAFVFGEQVELFVSYVGCIFAIPLALLVPPLLHKNLFPGQAAWRTNTLLLFGSVATVACLIQNLATTFG